MDERLLQDLTCPITLDLFEDPVSVPCCGKGCVSGIQSNVLFIDRAHAVVRAVSPIMPPESGPCTPCTPLIILDRRGRSIAVNTMLSSSVVERERRMGGCFGCDASSQINNSSCLTFARTCRPINEIWCIVDSGPRDSPQTSIPSPCGFECIAMGPARVRWVPDS